MSQESVLSLLFFTTFLNTELWERMFLKFVNDTKLVGQLTPQRGKIQSTLNSLGKWAESNQIK